jgi:sigma-E factor negative regulatory protein RseA
MDGTNKMDNQELISALADGQLQGEAFARAVEVAAADPRARESWCAYHVVGEVLRTGRASAGAPPEAFLSRLQQRLREEQAAPLPAQPLVVRRPEPAANDWLWKIAAGVASVAAVAAVGWNLWGGSGVGAAQPQVAAAPGASSMPVALDASGAPMARDPRLDRLLAAHRQLGGGTALATSSGFLRNATFEGPAR